MRQQQVRSPEYPFFEAEKKKHFLSGSEAIRETIRKANVDMAISYPITPQSESMHLVGDLFAEGYVKEYFRGENEFAVMSSVAGVRVFTATGGPGTMRAFEMFPVWAGSRLPIVCAFLTRGINSPLTIQPDTMLENAPLSCPSSTGRAGWPRRSRPWWTPPRQVVGAPRVYGGMTMPAHLIVDEIRRVLQ
ncbi:NADH-dependent phenylglyoxylate dehydrogenase subunit alpha [Thiorhodovibrio winogradskyi]|uniref:NADH-dependent phenylglyoxylate dehydrogenase subunit alpha n=1 Tax=Thiorhodovibrio winogradskyi TaxID=77007 RepID=A0ABZ0SA80_9GAMM|nr:hypothetical protein [Thiorhodovibrio winogradskyi]